MEYEEIIESLKKYYKENPKLVFYKKCIDKIEENTGILEKIPFNKYILESVRINICYNQSKYKIYLYNTKKNNCTNYLIKLNDETKDKLIKQLVCVTEYNDVLSLARDVKLPKIEFKKRNDLNYIYVVISKDEPKFKNQYYKLDNLYEASGYLFGIDIFNILRYQRLDRIEDFIKKGGESYDIYKLLNDFLGVLKKYDWKDRERIVIFSSVLWQALGLTYTRDVDILILAEDKTKEEALKKYDMKKTGLDIDESILINTGDWVNRDKIYKYKSSWITHILPNLVGAEDIFEVISNAKYNFMFMGIKFTSLDLNLKKFLSRSNVNSLTDLIMLEKINKYELGESFCIPNMTIRTGKLVVFDDKYIEKIHHDIKIKVKEYYNYDISYEEVKKMLKKCSTNSYDIYKGKIMYDPDTTIIKKFHLDVKEQIFYKYCKNINYLLDVGTGKLTDARFWNRVGIKNVIGIEPSIESIKSGMEKVKKFGTKTNIQIVNGIGDEDWEKNNKYKSIFDNKYDVVTFQYTLHYMIQNFDILLNNLKKVIKSGTKIIMLLMDGNLIHNELQKYGRIEIRNAQEPIFSIVPKYDYKNTKLTNNNDVLVYFKGAYGVASGSIEPLVNIENLIEKLKESNIRLIERKKFLDYNSKTKHEMSYIQKKVSYYYTSLIFTFL